MAKKKKKKTRTEKKSTGIEAEDGENTTKMAIEIVIQSRLDFYELRLQKNHKNTKKKEHNRIIKNNNKIKHVERQELQPVRSPDF